MAVKIQAGDDVRRGDVFFVDPFEVIIKEELRGRHKPPTEDQIIERAISMLDFGQIQPVEARRTEDNRLMLTLGFTRCAAARLIRDGFMDSEGNERKDAEFRLKVMVTDCNDEAAFKRNVVENAHRNDTSAIDDALNHQILRDRYGMNDTQIARLYGESNSNRVCRYRKLLLLDSDTQDRIHQGKLTVQAALDALELPETERAAALAAATTGNGKVDGAVIRAQVRARHLRDDENSDKPASESNGHAKSNGRATHPLSMREVRSFFEGVAHNAEGEHDEAVQRFGKDILPWLRGEKSAKSMENALNRLLDAKRSRR